MQNLRQTISLDGEWDFWLDHGASYSADGLPAEDALKASVPCPWQGCFPAFRAFTGPVWYRREIEIPESWSKSRIFVKFGAADYRAEVWLDGKPVGEHEGGYLPFEFDVTCLAQPGTHQLAVRVTDPPELFQQVPHGKQSWYGLMSGLWQSVHMECRPDFGLEKLTVQPDAASGRVMWTVTFSSPTALYAQIELNLTLPDGKKLLAGNVAVSKGKSEVSGSLDLPVRLFWSPARPNLYQLEVTLRLPGKGLDRLSQTFGLRTIEARDGSLYLNGELLYLRGALDQDYYPDTFYTSPSLEYVKDEFRKARAMGLNCLRIHIKVPDPVYYEAADQVGMLVWADLPCWQNFTADTARLARETLQGMVERDGSHPSIIIWTVINEGWGLDLPRDPAHRAWMHETYRWLKQLDPTRLVVDNSACPPNFHIESDLDDFHFYQAYPDHRMGWKRLVDDLADRQFPTYSPHGDAIRTLKEPIVVSEFGNWGLPDVKNLLGRDEQEPWWFETGGGSGGVVYPHGITGRFNSLGLAQVFGGFDEFITATQRQQLDALKYEIETMRLRPEIKGYIITELTDLHWECNGLMDFNRNPKSFASRLADLQKDLMVIPEVESAAVWAGQDLLVKITVSQVSGKQVGPGHLYWKMENGAQGEVCGIRLQPGGLSEIVELQLEAPQVEKPSRLKVDFELTGVSNETLTRSWLWLSVYPRRDTVDGLVSLVWGEPGLGDALRGLGYDLADRPEDGRVVIADRLTDEIAERLSAGANLLLIANQEDSLGDGRYGLGLKKRMGTVWSGDWASSFGWLDRRPPFDLLPGGPLVDETFERIIPEYNLSGIADWEYHAGARAGMVVGWVHGPSAWIGQKVYGKGRLTATTFRLDADTLAQDLVARHLFQGLIRLSLS